MVLLSCYKAPIWRCHERNGRQFSPIPLMRTVALVSHPTLLVQPIRGSSTFSRRSSESNHQISLKNLLLPFLLGVGIASNFAAEPNATPPARESIEWCDIWFSHANETNLPRVLLIGDSIAREYYPEVEKRLAGKAFVGRLATSRFAADPVLLTEIATVLDGTKFDLIQFNNGMHGWQHSEEDDRNAFPNLIKTI